MAEEDNKAPDAEETPADSAADAAVQATSAPTGGPAHVHPVEFPSVTTGDDSGSVRVPLQRFFDVSVDVTVELGRVSIPLGELLKLGTGSVLELTRPLSEPVDIMAQGVRLARGEVVVVEDRYAVRITEIEDADAPGSAQQPDSQEQPVAHASEAVQETS